MNKEATITRPRLTTPRAAAVAGIIFSVLLLTSLTLIRLSVPADPLESGGWLASNLNMVGIALNLVPFAGIAFLWFIGVVRDRLGEYEDRFFSTVFLGSGLLFLAMLFASAALVGGIIISYGATPNQLRVSGVYTFGRAVTYEIINIYAIKMAGVFMISTCTLGMRTGIMPRWMALLGYALALTLLLSIGIISWISLVFPVWVLMLSIYILIENYRRGTDAIAPLPTHEAG
jgi:hypothetical protein